MLLLKYLKQIEVGSNQLAKTGVCPFRQNFSAKYSMFEIIQGNTHILKLDFWTIKLQRTKNKNKKSKNLWNSSSLKIFKWNLSSMNSSSLNGTRVLEIKIFFSKFNFSITRLSKNQVSKQGYILKQFQTLGTLLKNL